jgi:hypothetical protein
LDSIYVTDIVFGKTKEYRNDLCDAGFENVAQNADSIMGMIMIHHGMFCDALKVIRTKGTVHYLELTTNHFRNFEDYVSQQVQDALSFIGRIH